VGESVQGRVLIVDDEIDSMTPLLDLVLKWGFEATGCSSSTDALKVLKDRDFDLLLADLVMPEMDGIALIKSALDADPRLVCMVITGKGTVHTAVEAMKAGAFDYILKPVNFKMLQPLLLRAMKMRRLKEAEEIYRSIFETTGAGTLIVEEDTTISLVNRQFETLSGYSKKEIEGKKSWTEFFSERCLGFMKEYHRLRRMHPDKAPKIYESEFIDSTGNLRNVLMNVDMIPGTRKSVGSLLDITERKRSEETLQLLHKAVETIPIGLTITDTEGKIVYSNPADAKMHDYTVDELIGKSTRIFAPRENWKNIPFEQLKGLKTWSRESTNIRKNGEVFPVHLISVPVTDAEGKPIGIITTCQDITYRKQAEEKLAQRQEAIHSVYRIATTLDSSFTTVCDEAISSLSKLLNVSHGMVLRHDDGRVTVISGLTDGKLETREMVYPARSVKNSVINTRILNQLKGSLKEKMPDHPYAEYGVKTMINVPVIDTSGAAVSAIVMMDRKEREFTEAELQLIRIFARYIAFEIERDAMETKLQNARRMEVIGKLAGGVAHEVRNPLNAIMVISEALFKDFGENPEYKPFLLHIRSQVDRLSELMKDLLNLGKPVEQYSMQRESLRGICAASIDIWKHSELGRLHSVKMIYPPDNGGIFVVADSQRLQQVFINLFDNAARHSPPDSEITLLVNEPEEGFCRVQVTDSGSGIPADLLPRIFEPFFTTRRGGTGLGLSIVKHIIESHGGTVEMLNNEPPPGCTVDMRLPVSREKA
jgi:PAS domain S-box-containing protein